MKQHVIITEDTIGEIKQKIREFEALVHEMKARQDKGEKLADADLTAFKDMVIQLVIYDFNTILSAMEGLIAESENAIFLLQRVAESDKEDDELQKQVLEFLASLSFAESDQ